MCNSNDIEKRKGNDYASGSLKTKVQNKENISQS